MPDAYQLLVAIWWIDVGLLIFNMLPIYPLDGGQILRSLLWYGVGRARSLMVATVIGFIGVAGLIALAVWTRSLWFGILSAFILLNCWNGLQHAFALSRFGEAAAASGIRVSFVQDVAAYRQFLGVRAMRECLRHVSNASGVPAMRRAIFCDGMPRLRQGAFLGEWVVPVIVYDGGEPQSVKGLP